MNVLMWRIRLTAQDGIGSIVKGLVWSSQKEGFSSRSRYVVVPDNSSDETYSLVMARSSLKVGRGPAIMVDLP